MVDERQLGSDIELTLRHAALRPVYHVHASRQRRVSGQPTPLEDFGLIAGRQNLAQAIIIRLLTPRGELMALGHPDYGSRLYELIGRPNTETTRRLLKLFVIESLQREPRIAAIEQVTVAPVAGSRTLEEVRHRVNLLLRVRPIAGEPITVGPLTLELTP
jgi:phage baseplate assembly protein W